MNAAIKIFSLFFAIHLFTWTIPQTASAQVSASFQVFYDDLSPYGNWIDNSDYGYVWVPHVSRDFSPYGTNGYWIFTDDGWTWVSDYSWGWAPFHYGRWYYDSYYRWIWVPDNEWGPGWVSWRSSDEYYGWAPMGPDVSIDIAYSNGYSLPSSQWRFVRNRDFGRTNINNYYISSTNNTTIINNTTVINNIQNGRSNNVRYSAGPERTEVERQVGKKFTPVVLRERDQPGQTIDKGELRLYRPQVQKNNNADRRSAPSKVERWKNGKPETQENTQTRRVKENQINNERPTPNEGNGKPYKERQRNNQPGTQQQQRRGNDQSPQQQTQQRQRNDQPVKQQPEQQKMNDQAARQLPPQQRRKDEPVKQQPTQQKHNDQPARQQPSQQRRNDQPASQPTQQKHDSQPKKDQRRKSGQT
jgi:hypothetical protein